MTSPIPFRGTTRRPVRSHVRALALALGLSTVCTVAGAGLTAVAHSSNAKAVSLTLNDVRQVLDRSLTAVSARSSTPHAMGVCTATPPLTEYDVSFTGSLRTKGVIGVTGLVYTYGSAAGPICREKSEITMFHLGGAVLGEVMTPVHGVGTQAYLLDTTGPKTKQAPVYTLGLNFVRGNYSAVVIVQSNRKIKTADMIRLGSIADARMKHLG